MEPRHLVSAGHILKHIRYITLATVCEDGSPWNSPLSPSVDNSLIFTWGSLPDSIHSRNIERDGRAFVVIYDSTAPEGTGEAVYFSGKAEATGQTEGIISLYRFIPDKAWINDEAKNEDGSYRHDIRVDLDLTELKLEVATA